MAETKATKDPKPIDTIGAWIKAAQLKRNQNNAKFLQDTKSFLLTCEARSEVLPILQAWEKTPITNKTIEAIFAVLSSITPETPKNGSCQKPKLITGPLGSGDRKCCKVRKPFCSN